MVHVEGRPKLEIACNLQATDGMKVRSVGDDVELAHKWALEFHLINHPLDCPICDQAGECGLQDYYMKVGKYQSEMRRPKVLKPKALDVGTDLVLDTERCILCSRCVRFEDEITKTQGLGIFDRGDRSIIGTFPNKKIEHKYQDNLVDICPVGAFTSKDFRFKQRVWFLREKESTCPGCATGCQIIVYGKPEVKRLFRNKPRESEINGHWMCDIGRQTYKHANKENRLLFAYQNNLKRDKGEVLESLRKKIHSDNASGSFAFYIAPQYTCEELEALKAFVENFASASEIYEWRDPSENKEAFDGLLLRGDRNSNSKGFAKVFGKDEDKRADQLDELLASGAETVFAFAPEWNESNENFKAQLKKLSSSEKTVCLFSSSLISKNYKFDFHFPTKTFVEKDGHFLNYAGKETRISNHYGSIVDSALDMEEICCELEQKPEDERVFYGREESCESAVR